MTVSRWSMSVLVLIFSLVAGLIGCGGQAASPLDSSRAPSAASSPSDLAVVSVATGEVLVMKSGYTTWRKVSVGMVLDPGDRIKVGSGSKAVITFFDGSAIELKAGTEIAVNELSIAEDTGSTTIKLWQQIGKTRSRVEKLADTASRYEIETPACAAVVRGSIGDVRVFEDGKTEVYNVEGKWCAIAQGVEVCMPAGTYSTVVPGQPPSSPVSMPTSSSSSGDGGDGWLPPHADFSAAPTSGQAPLTVQFADESTGDITRWSWDFGDSGSDEQNPVYTYHTPGTYTVSLTVFGPGGSSTKGRDNYIFVGQQPCQEWVQTTVDDFNAGTATHVTVVDVGSGDGTARLAIDRQTVSRDQYNWPCEECYDSHQVYGAQYQAQTFVAGMTGNLVKVALHLAEAGQPPGRLVIQLRNCVSAYETYYPGNVVYAAIVTDNISQADGYEFFFPMPCAIVSGTHYAIVLHQESNGGNQHNCYLWFEDRYDPYSGGMVWQSTDGGSNWFMGGPEGEEGQHDFYFETYVGTYYLSGTLESSTYDCGSGVDFCAISWVGDISPGVTDVTFQIATNNDGLEWNFVGPDGTSDTYYGTSGTDIWSGHNGHRYIRYTAYFSTTDSSQTPRLEEVSIGYR